MPCAERYTVKEMRERPRVVRWWLIGYSASIFLMLPLALPVWKRWLEPRVGSFVSVEAIHVAQYLGLGALAAGDAFVSRRSGRRIMLALGLVAVIGVLDESFQRWLPQRVFDWSDIFLNWTGGLLGFLLDGLARWATMRIRWIRVGDNER